MSDYAQHGLQTTDDLTEMLKCQVDAIWPQEVVLFRDYFKKLTSSNQKNITLLDVGTGTGEIAFRIAKEFPNVQIVATDLEESNIKEARKRLSGSEFEKRVTFQVGNIFDLKELPSNGFDIVTCRSTLHAIENQSKAISSLARLVNKNGGMLHMLNEDYGMINSYPYDSESLWKACQQYFHNDKANPHMGRSSYTMVKETLPANQISDIRLTYIQVDTVKVPREIVSKIYKSWRDGYSKAVAKASGNKEEDIIKWFNGIIECSENPNGYSCWQSIICTVEFKE